MVTVAEIAARSGVPVPARAARPAGGRHPRAARHRGSRGAGQSSWRPSSRARRSWARRPSSPSPGCSGPPPTTSPRRPSRSSSPSSVRAPCARGPTNSPGPGSGRGGHDGLHGGARRPGPHGDGCLRAGAAPGPRRRGRWLGRPDAVDAVDVRGADARWWPSASSTSSARPPGPRRLNLRDQSLALTRFESAAWSSAVLAGGRVVKTIGDEVFFAAPTADAACRIGLEVCRAAAQDHVLPPARGAVGIGPATPREGDYFGPLVNLLSRLVKAGAPGELVVTEAAAAALSPDEWSLAAARAGRAARASRSRSGRSGRRGAGGPPQTPEADWGRIRPSCGVLTPLSRRVDTGVYLPERAEWLLPSQDRRGLDPGGGLFDPTTDAVNCRALGHCEVVTRRPPPAGRLVVLSVRSRHPRAGDDSGPTVNLPAGLFRAGTSGDSS